MSSVVVALKEWTQVAMQIMVNPGQGQEREGRVDIFEYYWAPETEDKLSWRDTLTWLVRTDLTPLRYFADNLQEMINARGMSFGSSLWYSVKVYAKEILRVLLLYVPLAIGLLWLLAWLSHPRTVWSSLQIVGGVLHPYSIWPSPLVVACYASGMLMLWFMLESFTAYLRRGRRTIQKWAEGVWFALAFASAVLFFWLGRFLSSRWAVDLQPLGAAMRTKTVLLSFAAVLVAAAWRYILTAYVADVAVYVTADAKSKNYAARNSILKGSSDALKRILAGNQYDRVSPRWAFTRKRDCLRYDQRIARAV